MTSSLYSGAGGSDDDERDAHENMQLFDGIFRGGGRGFPCYKIETNRLKPKGFLLLPLSS
jgi:hypothetical protein